MVFQSKEYFHIVYSTLNFLFFNINILKTNLSYRMHFKKVNLMGKPIMYYKESELLWLRKGPTRDWAR